MSRTFNEETVEEIRSRVDIVELISEYVVLKSRGNRFVGLCPFHNEKTPSFTVTPEKGIFYCFGCGEGGDIFSFLMKYEHLDFPQAVERLAQRVGLDLVKLRVGPADDKRRQESDRLKAINRLAARFYYQCLLKHPVGQVARDYLVSRGLNPESCKNFGLGYAPDSWNSLLAFLEQAGCRTEEMVKAGVIMTKENGKCYDRFRKRLMFPIMDLRGNVVGFGGRVLGSGEPKYLNSPETPVFQKKSLLYGLHPAIAAIRQKGQALLMEGYMDVITAHQFGVKNAVASLGTAFTKDHARVLMRYTREIVLLFDSDTAGVQATDRAIDIFQELGFRILIANLAGAKDPDEFLKNRGKEAFENLINEALPVISYKLRRLKTGSPLEKAGTKAEIVEKILPELGKLNSQIEVQEYIRLLAKELEVTEEAILADFKHYRQKFQKIAMHKDKTAEIRNNSKVNAFLLTSAYLQAQYNTLRLILHQPDLVVLVKSELGSDVFEDRLCRQVFDLIWQLVMESSEDDPVTAAKILHFAPEDAKSLIARLAADENLPLGDRQIEDTLKHLELHFLLEEDKQIRREIAAAEEAEESSRVEILLQEISNLQRKIHLLK